MFRIKGFKNVFQVDIINFCVNLDKFFIVIGDLNEIGLIEDKK